jgi:hypothetical protein
MAAHVDRGNSTKALLNITALTRSFAAYSADHNYVETQRALLAVGRGRDHTSKLARIKLNARHAYQLQLHQLLAALRYS